VAQRWPECAQYGIGRGTSSLLYGQGNGGAVGSAPCCPKFSIVGPDLQIFVASAENRETSIRPVRFVVSVLDEPVEHLEPHVALVCDRKWLHAQIVQEGAKPLPLVPIREVKTRFRQHGIAYQEVVGRQ